MEKTPIEELSNLIHEQIGRVQEGMGINTEIALLRDLERMAVIGVLTVESTSEIPKVELDGRTVSVEYKQPRLRFTGESEIIRLHEEVKQLQAQHEEELKQAVESFGQSIDENELFKIVDTIAYSQQGSDQMDDAISKMGILASWIQAQAEEYYNEHFKK